MVKLLLEMIERWVFPLGVGSCFIDGDIYCLRRWSVVVT